MSEFNDFLATLPVVSCGTTEACVTRGPDYWQKVGSESEKTFGPAGAVYEISNNIYEAGFSKIRIEACTKSRFSLIVKGYGNGVKLKDWEYKGKLLQERVDSGKEIGIHKGEGEQKAVAGQLYDKPDGYYIRGHFETNQDGERDVHFIIWDGKSTEVEYGIVHVVPEEKFEFIDEFRDCDVFAALTRSNFRLYNTDDSEETDVDILMRALQVNFAPAMLNKGLKISCKFGNFNEIPCVVPSDYKLNEFFENANEDIRQKLRSSDRLITYETDVENGLTSENGVRIKSHLKITAINLVSEIRDSETGNELFLEYAPDLYKSSGKNGDVPYLDKIIFCDSDYIYSVKQLRSIYPAEKLPWAGWDQYILMIVESDANFYRNWGYDSCKLNGFSDPRSELPKYIREKMRGFLDTLRRDRGETKSVDNNSIMFSVRPPARYGRIKIDDDAEVPEIRKARRGGELYEIIPATLTEEYGISEDAAHKMFEITVNGIFEFMGKFLTKEYTKTKALKQDGYKIEKFLNQILELKD